MYSLIDLYFDKVNYLIPTLHKPTFFRLVEDGVHHKDIMFGALVRRSSFLSSQQLEVSDSHLKVLAACALGAAAGSDDPRMIAPDAELPVARGLDYVRQIWQIRKGLIAPCSLYEIQLLCVSGFFRLPDVLALTRLRGLSDRLAVSSFSCLHEFLSG